MLGQLLRNFYRSLSLHSQVTKSIAATKLYNIEKLQVHPLSSYSTRTSTRWKYSTAHNTTVTEDPLPTSETESTVALQYDDTEEDPRRSNLAVALRKSYRLTDKEIENVLKNEAIIRAKVHRSRPLVLILEILCSGGVDRESLLNYPWLLTLNPARLQDKLDLLSTIPLRDINDFAPFLRLTAQRLSKLVKIMVYEKNRVPHENRIYYISEMLQVNPRLIAKYVSKRLFIMEMAFETLEENLNLMIHYNVSPQNLLNDLWAFRYRPKAVQLRLERATRAKKDKIMPWMIRASERILQRSFQLTLDELNVLGDKKDVYEYIADRLGFDVESTKWIVNKHPAVARVRVTKIKEIIDYLLNEAGFTRHDIAAVPRILCHSLETTKERLQELERYDCRPNSLVIVCRSKREYEKFVKSWLETRSKMRKHAEKSKSDTAET
ncbi:transcription termination factor, mitochondrial [Eurosta solidaginis]|uniref:transcription termination factor, mitochondrial n=1 Tax=Eurosta solidaginis TaxID=178769 RepID=UPI0035311691